MEKLKSYFQRDMIKIYMDAKELGYVPVRFLQMIDEYGALRTAKKLLATEDFIQEGVKKLWELKRLDLSVEALVINEKYSKLFLKEEKMIAQKRLKDLGYLH
jgi:hypothetical protein